jgi:hypothetical protein
MELSRGAVRGGRDECWLLVGCDMHAMHAEQNHRTAIREL